MCGRFYIDVDNEVLMEIINEIIRKHGGTIKTGEIFPSESVPILTPAGTDTGSWGFPVTLSKNLIINARAETIREKPMFRDRFKSNRCIIPCSGFFEWQRSKEKTKHLFFSGSESCLYLGGIYGDFDGKRKFTVLTAQASGPVLELHDRMPVLLPAAAKESWLKDTDFAADYIRREIPVMLTGRQA